MLYKLITNKAKKTGNYENSWSQKIFISFSTLFNRLVRETDLQKLNTWYVDNGKLDLRRNDFLLYVSNTLNKIIKITSNSSNDILYTALPYYFTSIISIFEINDGLSIGLIELLMEKATSAFDILTTISVLSSKFENARSFLKIHMEKLQKLFCWCISSFYITNTHVSANWFEDDTSILGRLYSDIYELSSIVTIKSDLEGLPIAFFSNFLKPVCFI